MSTREEPQQVYSTDKEDNPPFHNEHDEVRVFQKEEIDRMSFIAKRSKNVKPHSTFKRSTRHGRVIRMENKFLKGPHFRVFEEVFKKSGTIAQLSNRLETSPGAVGHHLNLLLREFEGTGIFVRTQTGKNITWSVQQTHDMTPEALFSTHLKAVPHHTPRKEKKLEVKESIEPSLSPLAQMLEIMKQLKEMPTIGITVDIKVNFSWGK